MLLQKVIPRIRKSRIWRARRLWLRLATGFGALLAIMATTAILAGLQMRTLLNDSERISRHSMERLLRVQELDQHAQGHGNAMSLLLTSTRPEREQVYPIVDAEYAALERLLVSLSESTTNVTGVAKLRDIAGSISRYRSIFIEVVELIEAGDLAGASKHFNGHGRSALIALLKASNELLAYEKRNLDERQALLRTQVAQAGWFLSLLTTLAVALSVWLAWRTASGMVLSTARVEMAANRIAAGNYSSRIEYRQGDELSRVADAINTMAEAVASREAQIERVAYFDRLTGLPNRVMLRRAGKVMLRRAGDTASTGRLSLILMDVARLRTINEVLGFENGDKLLVKVAEHLSQLMASEIVAPFKPFLARLTGGVFAVLVHGLDRSGLEQCRQIIESSLSGPLKLEGQTVDMHLTFGLTESTAGQPDSVGNLLLHSETALHEAKQQKRKWGWYSPVDETVRAQQLAMISNLRTAASAGELEMWLQPKQCLRTGRLVGAEGLVRWRHPDRGYLPPDEFIPFAERTGDIGIVTDFMLGRAMEVLSSWRHCHPELTIAINFSAMDLSDLSLAQRICSMALQHRVELTKLRIEITESSAMVDTDQVLAVLHSVRALGVQISIDDFGTGYSSLAYLQQLPVNELKIDRAFVAGADRTPAARTLLRTIIDLGHGLDMVVTAEGVERAEERELLAELGCDLAQGYLIARPMSVDATEKFLTAHLTTDQ